MFVNLKCNYRVESNRESGYGRFDIAFFPLTGDQPGIILEIKAPLSEKELEDAALTAVKQIEEKKYAQAMVKQGVAKVWKYGIAVCGKKVAIKRG